MSTPHTIPRAPRSRINLGTLMTALGVLVAIATTITLIALTGANHTTAGIPATPIQSAASATPHVQYLGPRQQSARPGPQTNAANPAPHYTCLGTAHDCLP